MKSLIAGIFVILSTASAGEFVNLGFDDPDLSGSLRPVFPGDSFSGFWGETSRLLRGWSLTLDGNVSLEMTYNPWPRSALFPGVNLYGYRPGNESSPGNVNRLIIDSSQFSPPPFNPEVRIWQTGVVPINAVGLQMFASALGQVLVNGEVIGATFDGTSRPLDISRFAGQEVRLEFLFSPGSSGLFDILGFTQIPEPSIWVLFGVGALALGWAVRQRRSP
jgi:PEP-CTERM motif